MAQNDVQEIVEEAKDTFDLSARLRNVPKRTQTVTVYTDEVLGADLGGARDVTVDYRTTRERWGLLGEVDRLKTERAAAETVIAERGEQAASVELKKSARRRIKEIDDRIDAIRAEAAPIVAELEKSALVFDLRAVPRIILKDCRRRMRDALEITTKNIPESKVDDAQERFEAEVLAASVASYFDRASGSRVRSLRAEDAIALRDYLPNGEYAKLDQALGDLQYRNVIADAVTDDSDF